MTTAPPHPTTSLGTVTTIGDVLPVAARRFGEKTALVLEDRSFTFADLEQRSNRVASGLASLGVRPGDRVTLYGPNCWEWVVAYYAIAKTGAVVNPISAMLTPEEVRYVVADSGARVVVTSVDKGLPLLDLRGGWTRSRTSSCGVTMSRTGSASFAALGRGRRSGLDARAPGSRRPGGDLLHVRDDGPPEGRDAEPPRRGRRRGRHGADGGPRTRRPGHQLAAAGPRLRLVRAQRRRCWPGRRWSWSRASTRRPCCARSSEHRATLMDGVPTAYYYLLAHPDFDRTDLSSLTRCWVGGQTLPSAKALEFTARTGCPIHEVWGMTELAGATSANPVVGPNKPGTIGDRLPGQRDAGRRHRRSRRGDGARRARRADVPGPAGDGRLLRQRARRRRPRSSRTAGSTPVTSRPWTRTATSRSSTGRPT